jgi:hypothetical protein
MRLLKAITPKEWANHLLDCAKFGLNIDEERTLWALRITGDLS